MELTMKEELINGLLKLYKERLQEIVLYGSVARGTETEESDIDIAIILKTGKETDTNNGLLDFAVDMDLKYDKVFSFVDIDISEFEKWQDSLPFYQNVKKEGVTLWKAA